VTRKAVIIKVRIYMKNIRRCCKIWISQYRIKLDYYSDEWSAKYSLKEQWNAFAYHQGCKKYNGS
jgi:hypothetical protein